MTGGGMKRRVTVPEPLVKAYKFARQVVVDYNADHGSLMAAAVSFYAFLSLIPLVLLAVAVAAHCLGSPERAQEIVFSYMRQGVPALRGTSGEMQVQSLLEGVVRGRGAATGIGIVILLWTGTTGIAVLDQAINVAWRVQQRRGFLATRVRAVLVMLLLGVLLATSFGITVVVDAVRHSHVAVLGHTPGEWSRMWTFLGYLLPFVVTVVAFTVGYRVLPNTKVPIRIAFVGGLFAGVAWEAAKLGFGWYVANVAAYSKVYGSLAGIILFLVWINYSAIITILGAELASIAAGRHRQTGGG